MNLKRSAIEPDTASAPILAVGGVVYRRTAEGQVELLLIRKRGGFWTLPKGKIKPGEGKLDAVQREIREETGIEGPVEADVLHVRYTIYKAGQPHLKTVTYYLIQACCGTLRPDAKEQITDVRWFGIKSAIRRIRRERVRAVVLLAQAVLEQRARAEE